MLGNFVAFILVKHNDIGERGTLLDRVSCNGNVVSDNGTKVCSAVQFLTYSLLL